MQITQPVAIGRFIKRYKRFLTDVELDGGEIVTVHCPNTGSMKGCLVEGARVAIRD
ncbi:MAG: DNA/RNA nuclease SfsA, partial [Planctomycetota bacterium]